MKNDLEQWVRDNHGRLLADEEMPVCLAAQLADAGPAELDHVSCVLSDLSDRVELYFDTLGAEGAPSLDYWAVQNMCRVFRPAFITALLIDCARQIHAPCEPRTTHIGQRVIHLVADLKCQPRKTLVRAVLERACDLEPGLWRLLDSALDELEQDTCEWTRWPRPELAQQVRVQLSEVGRGWRDALEREWAAWQGGVEVLRGAQQWYALLVRIVDCLATPRADVRLSLEYGLAILSCNAKRRAGQDASLIAELAVFEAFVSVQRALRRPCVQLEVGDECRRKRLPRARSRVLTTWRESIESTLWENQTLPQLTELASRIEQYELRAVTPEVTRIEHILI